MTLALTACGTTPVTSATISEASSPLEAPVSAASYAPGTILGEQGWQYVAPGVAVSKQEGGYSGYVSNGEINEKTLPLLDAYIAQNPDVSIYKSLRDSISNEVEAYANGDIKILAASITNDGRITAQASSKDTFDWFTSKRTGCQGSVSAMPATDSRNIKTYAQWSCGKTYTGVVELRVTKGNMPRTAYLAQKGYNVSANLFSNELPGNTFCSGTALLRIVNPNNVTINHGLDIGGSIRMINLNYKGSSEVVIKGASTAYIVAEYKNATCK